jgi:AcrR family transcriptional regulator
MEVKDGYTAFGRMNQKRRTREAIKRAAVDLIEAGEVPSIPEVAEAALVSRSTAYRYFPSQEALVAEVLLDAAVEPGLRTLDELAAHGAPAVRLDAVVRGDHQLVIANEEAFRAGLRAMLLPRSESAAAIPRRPGNRLRYLGSALADLREVLGDERWERLVAALALCVGIESLLVTTDVCGLDEKAAEAVKRWAAAALLQAALQEAAN